MGDQVVAVVRTLLALLGVCALAWFVLGQLARRGVGVGGRAARMRVLERITLAPRRQLYLVRVDERELLIGAGETGGLMLITELADAAAARPTAAESAVGAGPVADTTGAHEGTSPAARIEA